MPFAFFVTWAIAMVLGALAVVVAGLKYKGACWRVGTRRVFYVWEPYVVALVCVLGVHYAAGPHITSVKTWIAGSAFLWLASWVRPRPGTLMVLGGYACQMLVVVANGGVMPMVGHMFPPPGYVLLNDASRFWWLGDMIYCSGETFAGALSIGDLLICVGVWWIAVDIWRNRASAS